jgi:hypothetical protein
MPETSDILAPVLNGGATAGLAWKRALDVTSGSLTRYRMGGGRGGDLLVSAAPSAGRSPPEHMECER